MRIKLTLRCRPGTRLPRDTHYPLASAIYNIIAQSDPDYAEFLHDQGYRGPRHRYKPYTFSWLQAHRRRSDPHSRAHHIIDSQFMTWYLTSGVDEFLQHLVTGFFETGGVRIHDQVFPIETVETLTTPNFYDMMAFTCLSPFVCSIQREDRSIEYLKEDDDRLNVAVSNNLASKFELLSGEKIEGNVQLTISPEYKKRARRLTKTILIRGGQPDATMLIGIMAPFTLTAPVEFVQTAYECGLGEHTAQGCGMIDIDRRNQIL